MPMKMLKEMEKMKMMHDKMHEDMKNGIKKECQNCINEYDMEEDEED